MRSSNLTALLLGVMSACGVLAVCALFVFLIVAKPTKAAPTDDSIVPVAGLQYEAMLGRQLRPRTKVDAPIVAGLAAGDRPRPGQMLFGAFIAVANDSPQVRRASDRIELRDAAGQLYRPLALPASNPYAYVARPVPPKTRIPGPGTQADDNLAATGNVLVFRIPAARFADGPVELVIHDAQAPGRQVSLGI